MERAILMSAEGRIVRVGFAFGSWFPKVMELRSSGHSIMALERVLRRIGRYVSRVNCCDSVTRGGQGAGYTAEGLTGSSG